MILLLNLKEREGITMYQFDYAECQSYEEMKEIYELSKKLREELIDSEYWVKDKKELYRIWRMV